MEEKKLKYLCKHCGENNYENFYDKRYTTCKKCRNKAKNGTTKEKTEEPDCLKDYVTKFLKNDRYNLGGYTFYEILSELQKDNQTTKDYIEAIDKGYNKVILDKLEITSELEKITSENRRLSEKCNFLIRENEEIRKENEEIKNLISKISQKLNL
jgi:hypothetical protein